MPYEDWWTKNKMSKYYYMFCTPNKLFAKGGVRRQVNYNRFEFIEWKKKRIRKIYTKNVERKRLRL